MKKLATRPVRSARSAELAPDLEALVASWSSTYAREVASCDDDDFGLLSARDRRELGLG